MSDSDDNFYEDMDDSEILPLTLPLSQVNLDDIEEEQSGSQAWGVLCPMCYGNNTSFKGEYLLFYA